MPGLVIASRRWNIGSDDIVVPSFIYLIVHLFWIVIYGIFCHQNSTIFLDESCSIYLICHVFGQLILTIGFCVLEICMIKISLQGSILDTKSRSSLNILLYIWFVLFFVEILWEIYGIIIIIYHLNYDDKSCPIETREKIFALNIFILVICISLSLFIWCAYDSAGRSWVRMKKFEQSLNNPNSKYKYKRSNSFHRNWRHREAIRKYERSWLNRCRMFCCIKNPQDNSFAEIAKLLSDFFRDLDVVPSDVIAGLSLMRVQQKALRKERIKASEKKIFQYLSGAAITSETKFVDLTHALVIKEIYNLIHYLHYSLAIYGWPMYMVSNPTSKWCHLLKHVKCCGNQNSKLFDCHRSNHDANIVIEEQFVDILPESDNIRGDNCCLCNRAAIQQTCIEHDYKIIFITYHVDIEKPPFFVAVDYEKQSIVISIRGTLSLYDILTDLNAEYELLPLNPPKENWFGHKGMVSAASYIRSKLIDKHIIKIANDELKARNNNFAFSSGQQYPIIIVGHSLGGGTAAILAVLLKEIYSNVICFAFAPPGGLISEEVAEYSKDFIISVVYGKDIVPRLGLHQMEKLRFDLIKSIKHCNMSKWKIIFKSLRIGRKEISIQDFIEKFKMSWNCDSQCDLKMIDAKEDKSRTIATNPNDETISMTVHTPLYPPGSIIHLVKVRPSKSDFLYEPKWRRLIDKKQYIIQAIWADYKDFDEILISPSMISQHRPDNILKALHSLLINTGPPKPQRIAEKSKQQGKKDDNNHEDDKSFANNASIYTIDHGNVILETSFSNGNNNINNNNNNNDSELYNEARLKRLRSLIAKRRAPLATPESISLSEQEIRTQDASNTAGER